MNAIKVSLSATIFILLIIASSFAQQTNPTSIILNGGFVQTANANVNYTKSFNFNSPSGFNSMSYGKATIFADNSNNGAVRIWVNVAGKYCNPNYYDIPANQMRYRMDFDCSDIIKNVGTFIGGFKASNTLKNVYSEWSLTYTNNPITLNPSGTEYQQYDNGTVFARLLDGNSRPVNLANCNVLSYYPNRTSIFFNTSMALLEKGIYYKDFTLGNVVGNYITVFDCIFPASEYFHRKIINIDIGSSNPSYLDVFPFDDNNNVTINSAWIFYNVTGGGGGASNNYYFNGVLVGSASGVTQIVNVTLNQSNFIMGESQEYSIIRTGLSSTINTVRLYVNFTYNSPLTTIRGQDEIHVGNIMSNINVSLINNQNNTAVLNAIADMNNTINSSFIGTNNLIVNSNAINYTWFDMKFANINNSINSSFIGLKNDVLSVNQSIWSGLNSINTQLNTVSSQLASVNNSVLSMNSSLSLQLSQVQNQLASVNNSILSMNISIYNNQQLILGNLSSIQFDLTSISNQIAFTNSTIHSELTSIENQIAVMNTTMISNFNSIDSNMASNFTFTNSLINSLNNTLNFTYTNSLLISINSTIMTKLYAVQNEISSVNNTVINGLNDLKISISNQFNNLVNILVNPFVNAVNSITGNTDSANRVFGITTGVSGKCSLGDRIIGKC